MALHGITAGLLIIAACVVLPTGFSGSVSDDIIRLTVEDAKFTTVTFFASPV
jgi:hypothetical protein